MNIQQEFSCSYPQLVYIDHKFLENNQIGVSFVIIRPGILGGGIKVFNIKDGHVQWKACVGTYKTWTDINQRTR